MKKILISLIITLSICGSIFAQPTVYFRMNNPRIDYGGTYLLMDVQIRSDVAGSFLFGGQAVIDLNAAAFNLPTCSGGKSVAGILQGTYADPLPPFSNIQKYGITYTVNGGRLNLTINPSFTTPPGSAAEFGTYYNALTTTWQDCFVAYFPLLDVSQVSQLVFNQPFMDGQMTYVTPGAGSLCNSPNLYYDDMNDLYLGKIYDQNLGWTFGGEPTALDGSLNISVWSGEGEINAAQATPAVVNNVRIHDHSGPTGTVGEAKLVINEGAGLTVLGDLENPIEEGVQILSDEDATGSLIATTKSGLGTYAVERYLSANSVTGTDYYFHQVAAPVENQVLQDFDILPGSSYAFHYNGAATGAEWENIYAFTEPTPLGYGFILSTINSVAAKKITFKDDISVSAKTVSGLDVGKDNLVGNPYPSPVDWDLMFGVQSGIVDEVRIWDEEEGTPGGNYRVHSTGTPGNSSCRYIQVGQSFFVESTTGSTFNFLPGHRVHNDQSFLKEDLVNYMRLYTIGGVSTWDELYIHFKDHNEATGGYDVNYDAYKWPSAYGDVATEIYTGGTDGANLTIDARPPIGDDMISIPLAFKAGSDATYSFGTEFIESFESNIKIMLEDKSFPGSEWFDMREGANYEFNATPEDPNDRFVLHFFDQTFGIDDKFIDPINIYSYKTEAVIVNNTEQYIKEILIYDMMGNLIVNKATVNASPMKIYVSDKVGYYAVKVITDRAVYTEKIFISR